MKTLIAMAMISLTGCTTFENEAGNCTLPPRIASAHGVHWQLDGQRVFKTQAACAAAGGVYAQAAPELWQHRTRVLAEQGDAQAFLQLGRWAAERRDYDEAYQAFLNAFRLGQTEGAWEIGQIHAHGLGRPVDTLAALNWFQKSAGFEALVTRKRLKAKQLEAEAWRVKTQQLESQLAQSKAELVSVKLTRLAALYRLNAGPCGTALDWQAFGQTLAGLNHALFAFDAQYQGWLWLEPMPLDGYLTVFQSFVQVARNPIALSPELAAHLDLSLAPNTVVVNRPADGALWRGTPVSWCRNG